MFEDLIKNVKEKIPDYKEEKVIKTKERLKELGFKMVREGKVYAYEQSRYGERVEIIRFPVILTLGIVQVSANLEIVYDDDLVLFEIQSICDGRNTFRGTTFYLHDERLETFAKRILKYQEDLDAFFRLLKNEEITVIDALASRMKAYKNYQEQRALTYDHVAFKAEVDGFKISNTHSTDSYSFKASIVDSFGFVQETDTPHA